MIHLEVLALHVVADIYQVFPPVQTIVLDALYDNLWGQAVPQGGRPLLTPAPAGRAMQVVMVQMLDVPARISQV